MISSFQSEFISKFEIKKRVVMSSSLKFRLSTINHSILVCCTFTPTSSQPKKKSRWVTVYIRENENKLIWCYQTCSTEKDRFAISTEKGLEIWFSLISRITIEVLYALSSFYHSCFLFIVKSLKCLIFNFYFR